MVDDKLKLATDSFKFVQHRCRDCAWKYFDECTVNPPTPMFDGRDKSIEYVRPRVEDADRACRFWIKSND